MLNARLCFNYLRKYSAFKPLVSIDINPHPLQRGKRTIALRLKRYLRFFHGRGTVTSCGVVESGGAQVVNNARPGIKRRFQLGACRAPYTTERTAERSTSRNSRGKAEVQVEQTHQLDRAC